jgi:Spy/CpxP family protein refolding chaperone
LTRRGRAFLLAVACFVAAGAAVVLLRARGLKGNESSSWAPASDLDSQAASIDSGSRSGKHGGRPGLRQILPSLNLTETQRTGIQSIMVQAYQAKSVLEQQLDSEKAGISAKLFAAGPLQDSDLEPQIKNLAGIQQQLQELLIHTAVSIRNLLTPDQLAQAAQLNTQTQALREQMNDLDDPQPDSGPEP